MDAAAPNAIRFPAKITKAEIAELPMRGYEGKVEIIRDANALEAIIPRLLAEPVIGFDTETRPAFSKGESYLPSLIQLGTADTVFLIQINCIDDWSALLPVFTSKDHVKAGVALDRDIKELRDMIPFKQGGFVELATFSDKIGIESNGLRPLAATLLGFRISKSAQTSNWANEVLEERQITYAATDAWVGREMHLKITEEIERRETETETDSE